MGSSISKLIDKDLYKDLKEYDNEKKAQKGQKVKVKPPPPARPTSKPEKSVPVDIPASQAVPSRKVSIRQEAPSPPETQLTPSAPRESIVVAKDDDSVTESILSAVLQTKFKIYHDEAHKERESEKWGNQSILWFKKADLPSHQSEVAGRCKLMLHWKLSRVGNESLVFCIVCYNRCAHYLDQHDKEHNLTYFMAEMLRYIQQACVTEVLSNLANEYEEDSPAKSDQDSGRNRFSMVKDIKRALFLEHLGGDFEDSEDRVTSAFLSDMLSRPCTALEQCTLLSLLDLCGKRLQENIYVSKTLRAYELLLEQPLLVDIVAAVLETEVTASSGALGSLFERDSILGPLLGYSSIPYYVEELKDNNHPRNLYWTTTLKDDKSAGHLKTIWSLVGNLFRFLATSHLGTLVTWLSALLNLNEVRAVSDLDTTYPTSDDIPLNCSDGFMLNLCIVMWTLCRHFHLYEMGQLKKVNALYCSERACLLNYNLQTCLAGGQIAKDDDGHPAEDDESPPKENIVTHIFHLTMRAVNIGCFPAFLHHHETSIHMLLHPLLKDRWHMIFKNEFFITEGTQFYAVVCQWLMRLMADTVKGAGSDPEASKKHHKKIFSSLPDFYVKDVDKWFIFAPNFFTAESSAVVKPHLSTFTEFVMSVLSRPDLIPCPITAYRTVEAFIDFLQGANMKTEGEREVLNSTYLDIKTNPTVYKTLGPALLRLYTSVGVVEGLDVNKEDFDKYAARREIGVLFSALWQVPSCHSSITAYCGKASFLGFLGAIIDTLLYQLHDSWIRLANIKKVENCIDDEKAWEALSAAERVNKQAFLAQEQKTAKAFITVAKETLDLLGLITQTKEVATDLARPPLSPRAASAFLGFFEKMCGESAGLMKVKNMKEYDFDPKALLVTMLDILFLVMRAAQRNKTDFVECVYLDDDYDPQLINTIMYIIRNKGIGTVALESDMKNFMDMLAQVERGKKKLRPSRALSRSLSWQHEADDIAVDEDELVAEYERVLKEMGLLEAELMEDHMFQRNAESWTMNFNSGKIKALMREMKSWGEDLPAHVHPSAAIFVRQDSERMDVIRALISGPVDTPYSRGCFAFDIYCPASYPNVPPMVKLLTTGNGTVRFNPNLYADGKVCLSLIGTWHGGAASQMWQPNKSSIYQVLVSIQSLILISDPLYNEPGYERLVDTEEGKERSKQYNAALRLWTVRYAMLGQLQSPTIGFEDVIREHFKVQKSTVLKQCSDWLKECEDKEEEKKLWRVVDDLRTELDKL